MVSHQSRASTALTRFPPLASASGTSPLMADSPKSNLDNSELTSSTYSVSHRILARDVLVRIDVGGRLFSFFDGCSRVGSATYRMFISDWMAGISLEFQESDEATYARGEARGRIVCMPAQLRRGRAFLKDRTRLGAVRPGAWLDSL